MLTVLKSFFIRRHLEYAIKVSPPILSRDAEALVKVQQLAMKLVKGRTKQHSNNFVCSPEPLGGSMEIYYPYSRSPIVFWNSPQSPSSPIQCYAITPMNCTNRNPPSPLHIQRSWCSILEQTTDRDSQCIDGEILQSTFGHKLAVLVPRNTHITHPLPQRSPSAHLALPP